MRARQCPTTAAIKSKNVRRFEGLGDFRFDRRRRPSLLARVGKGSLIRLAHNLAGPGDAQELAAIEHNGSRSGRKADPAVSPAHSTSPELKVLSASYEIQEICNSDLRPKSRGF